MMGRLAQLSPNLLGGLSAAVAVTFFSINDSVIKLLSGDYALHQVMAIRSGLGLLVILFVIAPLTDGRAIVRTKRLRMHVLRGLFVVIANMMFFLGLAAMPLAEAVAIFFIGPLIITVFSVIFLHERVGPRRWAAVFVGLIGVLIIVRPGAAAFQYASLLPITAAVSYAALHMITRRIGTTESAATMAFYIQITFILVSLCVGLLIGDGRFASQSDPSLTFLFRPWGWLSAEDLSLFLVVGVGVAFAGFFISQAYRVAEAGFVAPFEYLAMPLSILWGIALFGEYPDVFTWLGSTLIIGAGLFMLWRERRTGEVASVPRARR